MRNNHVELLAPAGNPEGFYGAIHAGADAVYLAGNRFGARAYADNFTTEELIVCIRYAHLWGRRVYLTVNTLVKETEFQEIYEYLLPFYEAGLDGVIVQDIGVLAEIREHFPSMELHASTQMTLTGEYGAKMLREMGVCRIVPARELSLEEIKQIKESTGLSMETFIHGAMCYCYSGQCLFSSVLGGRSGNRGRCAQPCRLPYEVKIQGKSSGECYPLSLKDMCTIEHLPELMEAGIDSFKIEGRMKKPEYAAGVTAIYRKYIDKYYREKRAGESNKPSKFRISAEDMKDLSSLYIRSERQDGYYYKHNGRDMVTLESPAYSGSDDELLARIREKFLETKPKRQIAVYAEFTAGKNALVTLVADELSVTVEGDVVQTASKQPITRENIAKQLGKLGESIFRADSIEIQVSDDAFYPLRSINELRREAVLALEDMVLEGNGFPVRREDACPPTRKGAESKEVPEERTDIDKNRDISKRMRQNRLCLSVRRAEQLTAITELLERSETMLSIGRLYLDGDLLVKDFENVMTQCRVLASHCEIIIALPYVLRRRDYSSTEKHMLSVPERYPDIFSGVQVRSLEGMGMLKDRGYCGKIYTDTGFYVWNRRTLQEWSDSISGFCMPFELKSAEQRELLKEDLPGELSCEKVIYGRIPMMITANCVANTTAGCRKQSGDLEAELVDRYHKRFPVELNCTHCMNIIYNSVPLSLHGELSKWKNRTDFRLDFTVENQRETREVISYFAGLMQSGMESREKPPYGDYTTGHERRGVE